MPWLLWPLAVLAISFAAAYAMASGEAPTPSSLRRAMRRRKRLDRAGGESRAS